MREPTRIACFHLNQVGDLLFSLPALYNLRARFPEARIVSVARPACRELLQLSGLVDKVIERPHGPLGSDLQVAHRLRREHLDLALLFSTSFGMWSLAVLSGARRRIGFTHLHPALPVHKRVPWSPPPSTENGLRLVEAIGCPVVKTDYVGLIQPGDKEHDAAGRMLRAAGISDEESITVLSPGTSSGREIKSWSDEGFAEVADRLAAESGIRSVVTGLDGGDRISDMSGNVVSLTGKTSLSVLAAVMQRSKLFIGVDSGAMHLAAAVGTPVVALFGATDFRITGPQGDSHRLVYADVPCRPCMQSECKIGRKCMEDITINQVMEAVDSCLR